MRRGEIETTAFAFASPSVSSTPSQRSLNRTISSFPLNSPSSPVSLPPCNHIPSTSSFNASLPQPLPQPLPSIPSSPPFAPASSFPSSSFLPRCFSVSSLPLSSYPFWAFGRSFRNHILKRILDIRNPPPNFGLFCGWTSASFFMCFCSHGPQTALFFAWRPCFAPCALECVFLAAPYLPHGTPCQHSSIFDIGLLISGDLLSVIVIQGTGHVHPPLSTSGRRLVFSGELLLFFPLPLQCDVLAYSCSACCHGCEVLPWKEIGSVGHLVR